MSNKRFTLPCRQAKIAISVAATVGVLGVTGAALATVFELDFVGQFTMIQPDGKPLNNGDFGAETNYYGWRTPVSGTFTFDTSTGTGSGTIAPFSFAGGGVAIATTITVQAIGNGSGGPGTLILGNLGFNWSGNNGIPVSIVLDGAGLLGNSCLNKPGGMQLGEICSGTGATPETDNTIFGTGKSTYTLPLGPSPIATTDWNTTTIGGSTCTLGCNPSGSLPLVADTVVDTGSSPAGEVGIGGSPMPAGPFPGWNANFDFASFTLTAIDGVGLTDPPVASADGPAAGETGVSPFTKVQIQFQISVKASTVTTSTFTVVRDSDGAPVSGTISPSVGNASIFQFTPAPSVDPTMTPLEELTTYRVTIDGSVESANDVPMGSDFTYTFTTGEAPEAQICSGTVDPTAPMLDGGSNFTMLDPNGIVFGGTNDVTVNLDDFNSLNNSSTGTIGIATNSIASVTPFFGSLWRAHDIRLFGPSPNPYVINSECSEGQLQSGNCLPNPDPNKNLTFTVGSGQIAAHILFDWPLINGVVVPGRTNTNIDVVNVWDQDVPWVSSPLGKKNDLYDGPRSGAGYLPGNVADPQAVYDYVSIDAEPNGSNGIAMIDGPFVNFNANFNLGPKSQCTPAPPAVTTAPPSPLSKGFFGCTLTNTKVEFAKRADLGILGGLLAAMAFWRRRNRNA